MVQTGGRPAWDMAKDGRSWFGQHFPELMRK